MSGEAGVMLVILAVMFAALIWDRFPAWLVFMAAIGACITIGLAPERELLAGFGNSGVVTVAVLYVVAAGMYSTGAVSLLANRVIGLPQTPRKAQARILPPIATGSAFLNNTPLVAMMIPVVKDISRTTGLAAAKLYMPLSFASLLGGASTLIGTSVNLIIAGLVFSEYQVSLNVFFPVLVGLPVAGVGILFLILIGTRLLPDPMPNQGDLTVKRIYRMVLRVECGSTVDGKTAKEAGLYRGRGYELVKVSKSDGTDAHVTESIRLDGGDLLEIAAEADAVPELWTTIGLVPPLSTFPATRARHADRLVEIAVSNHARAVGHKISELPLPDSPYELSIVAVAKSDPSPVAFNDMRVEAGDTAILEVGDSFFFENRREQDFTLIKPLSEYRLRRTDRAIAALSITGIMVLLAAFGVTSMPNAALLAALAMLLSGCISVRRAFAAVEWDTIVVLGAAVGLEAAVTDSGLSAYIADLFAQVGGGSAAGALTVVFVGAVIMTNVITNAAAAAFMFPVAVSLADDLGVSFQPFVVVLMLGCSYAFISPSGYQTNLMVQKPGGYKSGDFLKLGLPLTVVTGITTLLLTPRLYPF